MHEFALVFIYYGCKTALILIEHRRTVVFVIGTHCIIIYHDGAPRAVHYSLRHGLDPIINDISDEFICFLADTEITRARDNEKCGAVPLATDVVI